MPKIFIVGFGQFGEYLANSSELVVKELRKKKSRRMQLGFEVFPGDVPGYDRGWGLFELAGFYERSDGIIILNMSHEKRGLCIEKRAYNRISDPLYAPKERQNQRIDPEVPYDKAYRLDLDFWKIGHFVKECAKAKIPTQVSSDPGGFCGNHLMFQLCKLQRVERKKYGHIPWIFLNIPCSPEALPESSAEFLETECATMKIADVIRGLDILCQGAFQTALI